MPGRDQTGPMGNGPRTGWGEGSCSSNLWPANANWMARQGAGRGFGRCRGQGGGMGRRRRAGMGGYLMLQNPEDTQQLLETQKEVLQSQLNEVDKKRAELTTQEIQKK